MLRDLKEYDKDELVEHPTILTIQNNFSTKAVLAILYIATFYYISDIPWKYWDLELYYKYYGVKTAEEY